MKLLLLIAVMGLLVWQCQSPSAVSYGPGVYVVEPPSQQLLKPPPAFDFKGYQFTALADFQLEAKVLAKKHYRLGREAELSPYDLALGWGQMSDESILAAIDIRQSGRWYYWQVEQFPIPRRAIETQSANMHMIPANAMITATLKQIRPGQLVAIQGQLIRAEADDGWVWQSSLSREDTGNGACELVYVTGLQILDPASLTVQLAN